MSFGVSLIHRLGLLRITPNTVERLGALLMAASNEPTTKEK